MKTLNVRLLATLVGIGVVLAIVVFGIHRFQSNRVAELVMSKANEANSQKDLAQRAQATQYFRQYLGLCPDDVDARARLGLLYADLAEHNPLDYQGPAFETLERVLRSDGQREDVRRKLVDLLIRMGRFPDARAHIKMLQEAKPDDGRLLELLARCQAATKDYVAAKQSYETAIRLAPDDLEAYVGLARLTREHSGDIPVDPKAPKDTATAEQKADAWINKMVEQNPKSAKAYALRAEYFRGTGRLEQAQNDVTAALKFTPDDQQTLLLAVQIETEQDNFEKAREYARRAVELFPKSIPVYQSLAAIERQAGNAKQAREWLDKGLTATEDSPDLVWEKANLLIAEGDFEAVPPLIAQLAKSNSGYRQPISLGWLEGRLAFAQKEWAKARDAFEGIRTELSQKSPAMARQADFILAECYQKLGRPDLAGPLLRELQGASGAQPATQIASLRQLIAQGQLPAAIAQTRQRMQQKDAPLAGWLDLAKLVILQDAQRNVRLPAQQRTWTESESAVKKAEEITPDNPDLPLVRADLLTYQGRQDDARKLLEDAVKKDPTRWDPWARLDNMALQAKDWERSRKLLDEAQKHVKLKVSISLSRARLALARDGEKAAAELKALGEDTEGMVDSEKTFFLRTMAVFCLEAKDFKQAQVFCRQAADKDPSNLQLRVLLFEIARQIRDRAAMKEAVDEIGAIEQQGPLWHYYTALTLAMSSDEKNRKQVLKEAMSHLDQAAAGRPEWAEVTMLRAKLRDQLGDKDAAVESYLHAVEQGSRDPLGLGRLAQLLTEQRRGDEAARILDMLEQQKVQLPPGPLVDRGLQELAGGNIERGTQDLTGAADALRRQTADTKEYRQLQYFSQVLRALGELAARQKKDTEAKQHFDEAEKALRRAIELSPETTAIWIDLVAVYAQSGRMNDVGSVFDEIRKKTSPERAALTLARCYGALGRLAEAQQEYEGAAENFKDNKEVARLTADFYLRARDTDPKKNAERRKAAESLLREMINGKRPCEEEDIPWARRSLTIILAQRGDHRSYREAMDLVAANLKEDAESVPDKRLKARLLAHRPSRAERVEAMKLLEQLVAIPHPLPDDRFELAKLYFADKQWNKASNQMQPLAASKGARFEWIDFQMRAEIRAKEFDGATARLPQYERLSPDPFAPVNMRAKIYSGRSRHDQALRVLKSYVDNATLTAVPRPTRLRNAAMALDNLAKHVTGPGRDAAIEQYLKLAEEFLREYVQKDPSQTYRLVTFLGQHDRRADALAVAEKSWSSDPAVELAVSAVSLLSRGDPSPDEIARVETIMNKATAKYPDDIRLLLAMADLRSYQKRYDDADKLYRSALTRKDAAALEVIALNNLAVFLALRNMALDDAEEFIERAIELAGPAGALLDSRATIRLVKGRWQDALDDLNLALTEEQTGVRFFHLAQAYLRGGKKTEAAAAMKSADDLGLKVEHLQPLERPAYRKLREDVK